MCVIWTMCVGRCVSEIPVLDVAPTTKLLLTIFHSHDSKIDYFVLLAINRMIQEQCAMYTSTFKRRDR